MKVYSWKTLIVTILIGGGCFIYELRDFLHGEKISLLYVLFWAYLIIKGLWVSFTKEGYQTDVRNGMIVEKAYEKQFGKWAPIAIYGGFVLLFLSIIAAKLFPSLPLAAQLLFFIGLVYMCIIYLYIRKHIKEEKKKYFI